SGVRALVAFVVSAAAVRVLPAPVATAATATTPSTASADAVVARRYSIPASLWRTLVVFSAHRLDRWSPANRREGSHSGLPPAVERDRWRRSAPRRAGAGRGAAGRRVGTEAPRRLLRGMK